MNARYLLDVTEAVRTTAKVKAIVEMTMALQLRCIRFVRRISSNGAIWVCSGSVATYIEDLWSILGEIDYRISPI